MAKNYLSKQMAKEQDLLFNAGVKTGLQFGSDLAARAAKECGVSKRVVIEMVKVSMQMADEYWQALNIKVNPEADVLQEHFDKPLREIFGELYTPFEERYAYIKKCRYEK